MNILPKKSFHVLNKDNVAKVKRDEKEANIKAKESQERALKAEQEWRLSKLRKGAGVEKSWENSSSPSSIFDNAKSKISNKERDSELEKEKAKNEMKMGVLTYLGGSEWNPVSKRSPAPWYTQQSGDYYNPKANDKGKDEARKNLEDPLALMNSILKEPEVKIKGENVSKKERKPKYKHDKNISEKKRRDRIQRDAVEKEKRKICKHFD